MTAWLSESKKIDLDPLDAGFAAIPKQLLPRLHCGEPWAVIAAFRLGMPQDDAHVALRRISA